MLREILDVLDFLDDDRHAADPFATLLPDGDQITEITPFESKLGQTDFIKILFPGSAGKAVVVALQPPELSARMAGYVCRETIRAWRRMPMAA